MLALTRALVRVSRGGAVAELTPMAASIRDLSATCRRHVVDSLRVTVQTTLDPNPEAGVYPPGAQDWWASFVVRRWIDDTAQTDADGAVLDDLFAAGETGSDGTPIVTIGEAQFVVVDHMQDVYEALDARDSDLEQIGTFYAEGDWEDQLDFAVLESSSIIVQNVMINFAWRGANMGLLATGSILSGTRRGCAFAILHAMGHGADGDANRARANEGLTRYWGHLGFEVQGDELLVMDLSSTVLDTRLAALL